jgi:hypothetical protein
MNVAKQVAAVGAMTPTAIRAAWLEHYGSEALEVPASLLARKLTYDLQLDGAGGICRRLERRLQALGDTDESTKNGAASRRPSVPRLQPGSHLLREWGGKTHRVEVMADGSYVYDGRIHRSLSTIARQITGAHWSGPRFFGVRR